MDLSKAIKLWEKMLGWQKTVQSQQRRQWNIPTLSKSTFQNNDENQNKNGIPSKKLMFFVADLNAFLDCQMRTQYKWPHVQKISLFPCSFHVCRNPKQKPIPENIGFLLFVYNNCLQKLKLCVKSDQNNFMNSSLLLVFIRYLHSSSSLMADCKLFGSNVLNKKRL